MRGEEGERGEKGGGGGERGRGKRGEGENGKGRKGEGGEGGWGKGGGRRLHHFCSELFMHMLSQEYTYTVIIWFGYFGNHSDEVGRYLVNGS